MKLTIKIIISFVVTLFITTLIPRVIYLLFFEQNQYVTFDQYVLLIIMASMISAALLIYSVAIYLIVVRRIKNVSDATKKIALGQEGVHLVEHGHDEISILIENFNKMALEIQNNQYLNKEFARNYSHELKTPLSSIKGYAELIEMGNLTQQEIKEYSGIIIKESQRLADMSSTIMQISLLDSTNIVPQSDTYNLSSQIREIIASMQVEWESRKIVFDLSFDEFKITSNQTLLYHVWENLISNAIKFSNEGGHIEVSTIKKDLVAQVIIKDYGMGINDEDKKHIFDLFFTSSRNKNTKSNGIGLTLAKKTVDKLGGTISVTSVPEESTTFLIEIPLDAK